LGSSESLYPTQRLGERSQTWFSDGCPIIFTVVRAAPLAVAQFQSAELTHGQQRRDDHPQIEKGPLT
jgi:hypothetical protein